MRASNKLANCEGVMSLNCQVQGISFQDKAGASQGGMAKPKADSEPIPDPRGSSASVWTLKILKKLGKNVKKY